MGVLAAVVLASIPAAKAELRLYALTSRQAERVTVTDCRRRPTRNVVRCRVTLYAGMGPHARRTVRVGVVRFGRKTTVVGWA